MPSSEYSGDERYEDDEQYDSALRDWRRNLKLQLGSQGIRHTHHHSEDRRPLIDRVTNTWAYDRADEQYDEKFGRQKGKCEACEDRIAELCHLEDETSCANTTYDCVVSRRFRRMFLVFVLVLAAFLFYWFKSLGPYLRTEWVLKEGFVRQEEGTYGLAMGGEWRHGRVRIEHLDGSLVPGGKADPYGDKRLIFVGDIHGCLDELVALEEKVGFKPGRDHLIATGDVTTKGPDSVGVLDELIRINASSVRGNHEDRILEAARLFDRHSLLEPPTAEMSTEGFSKDARLLKQLKDHHLRYLREMPLVLRVPALPLAKSKEPDAILNEILVVHAGLVPHLELRKQDPYYVMNMRSIHPKTHAPSATRAGKHGVNKAWTELWNWYNKRLFKGRSLVGFRPLDEPEAEMDEMRQLALPEGNRFSDMWQEITGGKPRPSPQVVVYGHDSKTGLNLQPWSKGLDSACVKGGKLTALVLDMNGDTKIEHVRCKEYW